MRFLEIVAVVQRLLLERRLTREARKVIEQGYRRGFRVNWSEGEEDPLVTISWLSDSEKRSEARMTADQLNWLIVNYKRHNLRFPVAPEDLTSHSPPVWHAPSDPRGKTAACRTNSCLKTISYFIPRKNREAIVGDLSDDIQDAMRSCSPFVG
jgi:hypothetical protein